MNLLFNSNLFFLNPKLTPHTLSLKPKPKPKPPSFHRRQIKCSSSSGGAQIDMVRSTDGTYAPKPKKVVVLWDLDNKPPRGPPYEAAMALKHLAQRFGDVVDISAYANRHAFIHLPHWVIEQRRHRRRLDVAEKHGQTTPSDPYVCGVCGRKCRTNLDLKKHFRQLHERERQKKLNRMKSLKGKKRQRFKERFISGGNVMYKEMEKNLITPKVGYGLDRELRRAGVYVKTVEDKPQAADWAVKRQMVHCMSRGVDWLMLVSDDGDFREMLGRARVGGLGTVVVGDEERALGRTADLWVSWVGVEKGEVRDEDLVSRRRRGEEGFEGEDLEYLVDGIVGEMGGFGGLRVSEFTDGEEEDWSDEDDFLLDSEDEADDEDF